MNVMTTAKGLGLVTDERSDVSGTIDEAAVLAAISELALAHPANDDLFADASKRVQLARSAGLVRSEEASMSHRRRPGSRRPSMAPPANVPGSRYDVVAVNRHCRQSSARTDPRIRNRCDRGAHR